MLACLISFVSFGFLIKLLVYVVFSNIIKKTFKTKNFKQIKLLLTFLLYLMLNFDMHPTGISHHEIFPQQPSRLDRMNLSLRFSSLEQFLKVCLPRIVLTPDGIVLFVSRGSIQTPPRLDAIHAMMSHLKTHREYTTSYVANGTKALLRHQPQRPCKLPVSSGQHRTSTVVRSLSWQHDSQSD